MPPSDPPIVFAVKSSADLAIQEYYLDDAQRQHILLGHRGLVSAMVAIQSTVEQPTHIYRSDQEANRLLFISHGVVTGKGHPMKVIIEREGDRGKVITATWSGGARDEQLVWDSSGTIYSNYDDGHDVLYLSRGPVATEYAEDDAVFDEVWLRKNEENDTPQGVTVFGIRDYSVEGRTALFAHIAKFLGVPKDEIELRTNSLVGFSDSDR